MTTSKTPALKKLRDACAPRAMGDGNPNVYTLQEREIIFRAGLRYGRGLMKARVATNGFEKLEAFRRKFEINQIFRGLDERLRRRPYSRWTTDEVLDRLAQIGIKISERTLMRDYKALGGAKFLRGMTPFAPGENRSSPLARYRRKKSKSLNKSTR
jgi:hypothetical protein